MPDQPKPTIGGNLRRLRLRAGLRTTDLAKKIGVTPSVVSALERNRRGLPETPTVLKLANALECSIDELLRGVDEYYDRLAREREERREAWLRTQPPEKQERLRAFQQQMQKHRDMMSKLERIALEARIERRQKFMTPEREETHKRHRDLFYALAHFASTRAQWEELATSDEARAALAQRLRATREQQHDSIDDLAQQAGVQPAAIEALEAGAFDDLVSLQLVSAVLFVLIDEPSDILLEHDIEWFLGTLDRLRYVPRTTPPYRFNIDEPIGPSKEEIFEFVETLDEPGPIITEGEPPPELPPNGAGVYTVIVRSNGMTPFLKPGMRVIVAPDRPIEDGDLAYVHIKDGIGMLQIVFRNEHGWLLTSNNADFPPRFILTTGDVGHIHKVTVARLRIPTGVAERINRRNLENPQL